MLYKSISQQPMSYDTFIDVGAIWIPLNVV